MAHEESLSLKFWLVPSTLWRHRARCQLREPNFEGQFTNAGAVWTTWKTNSASCPSRNIQLAERGRGWADGYRKRVLGRNTNSDTAG